MVSKISIMFALNFITQTHMSHSQLRLEDLSLWFIEKGPIREMVEV